ncbi:MAG: aldo/keto reductase [bacterium]
MEIQNKTLKNGFSIPEYGIGTWEMGGKYERDISNDDALDIKSIQDAISLGVTHIDTAEIYAGGHTEEIIAEAIKSGNIDRTKLFITSKASGDDLSYDGIINSCKESLKRLGTDYLDLYLLHWYGENFSLEISIKALNDLKDQGLVKNIGVSNFGVDHLRDAMRFSKSPIVCDQVHYNLRVREAQYTGLLKFCKENDVMVVAYRPLEKGAIMQPITEVLDEMSRKYNKTPAQTAINWLISQENVVVIVKSRDNKHLEENLGSLGWKMSPDDVEKLSLEFPGQVIVSDVVTLG